MGARIDLTGQRFGRLRVVSRNGKSWDCVCDCGTSVTVTPTSLLHSGRKSCGCLHRESLITRNTKHGHRNSKIYRVWYAMKDRCTRKTDKFYADYGGRGISVCERWQSFESFLADMGEPPEGMQIDRIDNSGNYCPENCRWVTKIQNANNKRNNKILSHDGKSMSVSEWEAEKGFLPGTIKQRIYLGWDGPRAIETPVRRLNVRTDKTI